jgi:hypothetical protein
LNYVPEYYEYLRKICKPLYHHTDIVKKIKKHVKTLSCLGLPSRTAFKIVETDAFELGYGGILKQRTSGSKEQIFWYYSGLCNVAQQNYSTIQK